MKGYNYYLLAVLVLIYSIYEYETYLFAVAKLPAIDYDSYGYALLDGPLYTIFCTGLTIYFSFEKETKNKAKLLGGTAWCSSLLLGLVAASQNFWQVAVLRSLIGLAGAVFTPFATGILAAYFDDENTQGTVFGVFYTSIFFGYGLAISVGPFINSLLGWQLSYILVAGVGIFVGLIAQCTLEDRRPRKPSLAADYLIQTPSASPEASPLFLASSNKHDFWALLRFWTHSPALIFLSVGSGIRNAAGTIWGYYTALFFMPFFDTTETKCISSYDANLEDSQECTETHPYCVDGNCANLNPCPWHNVGMPERSMLIYMSWIPILAGCLGLIMGGVASDWFAQRKGPRARVIFAACSTVAAVPFYFLMLVLDRPWCFLSILPAALIGEVWRGLVMALIVELSPENEIVASTAIHMFIVCNVAGNAPILVPLFEQIFYSEKEFSFQAASMLSDNQITYFIKAENAKSLELSLMICLPGLYLLASLFFFATLYFIRKEPKLHAKHGSIDYYGAIYLHDEPSVFTRD
mmetsp:Transcript_12881/g.16936  ORF Transcript_12881/g.16936 Transcript_12881/m.16936 type:complete len:522 (-) Transcript_12881:35-1600(-)|eukprot:CAMPEP_0117785512 /NCGR_PEP_ID=MMETSP0948-20121206/5307_1 /TAXON_ID=44440 /ORGANISM="Chattonella subsalsa, Strain CCMP2191" /LENGTH=521 /DNA_ID=CAMNT_0005614391 /DNA_START=52 /DNA_END=1617 /DNA_ORIENTATION=-